MVKLPFETDEKDDNIFDIIKRNKTLSKSTIKSIAEDIASDILDGGEVNPLEAFVNATILIELMGKLKERLLDDTLTEIDKYGKDGAKFKGCTITSKSTATKFGYSNNEGWVEINKKLEALKAEKKRIEELMKSALKANGDFVDEDGVVIEKATIERHGKIVPNISIPK